MNKETRRDKERHEVCMNTVPVKGFIKWLNERVSFAVIIGHII